MRNHSSAQSNFLYALLLAIGSSTDNFTVGFTLGIKSNNNNSNPVNEGFAANENQRTFSSDTDDDHDRNANASTSTNVVIKNSDGLLIYVCHSQMRLAQEWQGRWVMLPWITF